MARSTPDLKLLDDVVATGVLHAMRSASSALTALGVRHAVAGGLAVGAYGYPRNTRDVDLLVGDEAFEVHPGGFVTMKPGIPIQIGGVSVDLLSASNTEGFLTRTLPLPVEGEVPVVSASTLVYLKLKSPRLKDQADVVELLKAGLEVETVRKDLERDAPALLAKLDDCVARARAEE